MVQLAHAFFSARAVSTRLPSRTATLSTKQIASRQLESSCLVLFLGSGRLKGAEKGERGREGVESWGKRRTGEGVGREDKEDGEGQGGSGEEDVENIMFQFSEFSMLPLKSSRNTVVQPLSVKRAW